jgi:hypothetical protein
MEIRIASSSSSQPHVTYTIENGRQLEMVPYRLIVEAVPHRDKDIREERESAAYCNETGSFSSQLWHERWGNPNSWEVWRMLEKEYYYKR